MFRSREFLRLYDIAGVEISANRDDLLCVESGFAEDVICSRVFGRCSGFYFLVSDRPGYIAQLLALYAIPYSIVPYPFGIANRPQWSFDLAIRSLREVGVNVPGNVCQLARQHVRYRAGANPAGRRKAQIVYMRSVRDVEEVLRSRTPSVALMQLAECAQMQDGIVDAGIFWTTLRCYCRIAGIVEDSDILYLAAQLTNKSR
ncbi:MAG: hypothetical protein PVI21_06195 [Candidatus Woesebacteria bacterium]|jgi:hypothetical protein